MIKAGIIGGSGYTGGELIRLLLSHSQVTLNFIYSSTRAGREVTEVHPDLAGQVELVFTEELNLDVDVVFLCLGHGNSKAFLKEHRFSPATKVIDLSTDFRSGKQAVFLDRSFVYGLPELGKSAIIKADNLANPGCFATAIQLALLPLAKAGQLENTVHINAVTGSTGAGAQPVDTTHFSWRNNNLSWYKPFVHQHLREISEQLGSLQHNLGELLFLPVRGNFTRGIFATSYTHYQGSEEEAVALYKTFYEDAPFTQVVSKPVALKQVVNTNQCHIHLHKYQDRLLITSVIDNLLKGASGQAVQNMNLIFGFEETTGLQLKAGVF